MRIHYKINGTWVDGEQPINVQAPDRRKRQDRRVADRRKHQQQEKRA